MNINQNHEIEDQNRNEEQKEQKTRIQRGKLKRGEKNHLRIPN